MARARVTFKLKGKSCALELTHGALEEIAHVNPKIYELFHLLFTRSWEQSELDAVLNAGLNAAGRSDLTAADVIEGLGIHPAVKLAREALRVAINDDAGEVDPGEPGAGKSTMPSDTASTPG